MTVETSARLRCKRYASNAGLTQMGYNSGVRALLDAQNCEIPWLDLLIDMVLDEQLR